MPASTPMPDVAEFVAVRVGAAIAIVAAQTLLLWLHEAGHWLAALVLRIRVVEVEIGRGPAWRVGWVGNVPVVVRRWPIVGGRVRVVWPTRGVRPRMVAFALAGPAVNVAAVVGFVVLWRWSADHHAAVRFVATAALVTACLRAVLALVPLPGWMPRGTTHDLPAAAAWLRMPAAERARLRAAMVTELPKVDFWLAFLRGERARAEICLHVVRTVDPDGSESASLAALLRLVDGDAAGALAEHERGAARAAARLAGDGAEPLAPADAAAIARELEADRVCYLVHAGGPAQLAEAERSSAAWTGADAATPGALRARGLVLLHRGDVGAAIATLRRAVDLYEPYWLRALGMAWLAHAYAEAGNARAARRWARAARRLHPQSLLLPARLRLVDLALARARPARAAAQPIR